MKRTDTWLASQFVPSPNYGERKAGVNMIVLHYTGMADGASALAWLCNPASQVSCHYFASENGEILQLVAEADRAWHAGSSVWAGETDINSRSIGIEIVNPGHDGGSPPFPGRQVDAVIALCKDIAARWLIAPQNVLAHSDIAPQRKQDPGEIFPWAVLHTHGVGHYAKPHKIAGGRFLMRGETGQPVHTLQTLLNLYGYGLECTGVFNGETEAVVRAFQRHFRPERVDGVADVSTLATLRDLLAHLPVPIKLA